VNITEASTVLALLHHLDGSHAYDETDLLTNLLILAGRAGKALQLTVTLDEDALVDTLAAVAYSFVEYEDEPARPIEDVLVGGDRL